MRSNQARSMLHRITIMTVAALLVGAGLADAQQRRAGRQDQRPAQTEDLPPLLDPARERPGLRVGDEAPKFTMLDSDGREVDFAELYRLHGPVVVVFYRGGWCPICVKDLRNWQSRLDEFVSMESTVIAITPETTEHAHETRRSVGATYRVVVDENGEAMRAFRVGFEVPENERAGYRQHGADLAQRNASGRWELPAPAVFVVGSQGVVRWVFADWDYRRRASPDEALEIVRSLR